jgi:hypothetical protein
MQESSVASSITWLSALPADLPIGAEIPHAAPTSALKRAKLALEKTRLRLR